MYAAWLGGPNQTYGYPPAQVAPGFTTHASEYEVCKHEPQPHQAALAAQYGLSPDIIAAVARALGQAAPGLTSQQASTSLPPVRKYFSNAITNTMSDLPLPVIK